MCESIVSVSSREVIVRDRSISATAMRVRHGMGISSVEDIATRATCVVVTTVWCTRREGVLHARAQLWYSQPYSDFRVLAARLSVILYVIVCILV